uniref:Rhoptry associated membrane antigen n=1 Tax=Echinococcus granulosus TaxID=6210 RepID=A0A068WEF1_ECHGR|nr:rhoptry associated membrane antigen [Echinococcus granulosus]
MDDIDQSSREGSANMSSLGEEVPGDLANDDWPINSIHLISQMDEKESDSYRPSDNGMTLCEAETSLVDEAPESTINSSATERCLENSENSEVGKTFTPSHPTESEITHSLIESQVIKEDTLSSIVDSHPSKDLMSSETESGPALITVLESTEGSHRLAEAQPIDVASKSSDRGSLDSRPVTKNSESRESQESDFNVTDQEEDTLLPKGNAYRGDLPVITIDETDPPNNQKVGNNNNNNNNNNIECNHTQSCEPGNTEEVKSARMGIERELNLEEFADPMEAASHDEDGGLAEELPSVIVEERLPAETSTHKVYAQTQETMETVSLISIDGFKSETLDPARAKAVHYTTELQTATVYTAPVEFPTFQTGNSEFKINKGDEELELAMVQSTEMTDPIPWLEFKNGELVKLSAEPAATNYELETKYIGVETQMNLIDESQFGKLPTLNAKSSFGSGDDKENKVLPCAETNCYDAPQTNRKNYAIEEKESNTSDGELDFDTRYALFVEKILPGHEIYYTPSANSKKKQVTFRRGGTLDQRHIVSGSSPLWDALVNIVGYKSATLEAPLRSRLRLQPKPAVNDDHLFPDSVTPSKVEKALSEDDTSASNEEGNRYDVPFMDDDAFVPKKYRSVVVVEDDCSSESDYSDERRNLLGTEHLAKMDETSSHIGLATIDGKRNIDHESGSRWTLGLSICGCLRRRR